MPIFLYSNPETNELREIVQSVHEEHIFIDENGLQWQREFTIPTATVSSIAKIDPHNKNSFMDVTSKKAGTLGDMMDLSKELSQKREKIDGKDKLKDEYYKNYSKSHDKKDHPDIKKQKLKDKLSKKSSMFEWKD
jgi:hypothetical protein